MNPDLETIVVQQSRNFRNDRCSTIKKPAEMFSFVSKISDQTHLQTLACMILQNINLIMREEEEEKTR
jgi:hypothetical protein